MHGGDHAVHGKHSFKVLGAEGYFAGVTALAGIGKRFYFSEKVFGSVEAKISASTADIAMEDASIDAPNVALHFTFGLGYDHKRGE